MRRAIAALVCVGLISSTYSQTAPVWTPHPVSIALTVGQWLMRDNKKLFYVEVQSTAPTFIAAKNEGFRLAVEHAVGTVISSETEVRNAQIKRDEIISYASGYVDRFEIVNQTDTGNGIQVTMRVWVAHSAIANRLLNTSETAGQVDGDRAAVQYVTINQERQTGDRLLNSVLADFPKRAFDIKLSPAKIFYTSERTARLQIRWDVSWNKDYLKSLTETLRVVEQSPQCNKMLANCTTEIQVQIMSGMFGKSVVWFNEPKKWQDLQRELSLSRPSFLVTIRNQAGNIQHRQCFWFGDFVGFSPKTVHVNGNLLRELSVEIDLTTPAQVYNVNQIEIKAVRQQDC